MRRPRLPRPGTSRRDGLMKIVGECRDAAASWKLISDEGDPVKSGHLVSRRPLRRPFQQVECPSEIRRRQSVEAAAPRRVGFARRLEDAIAVSVESDQKLIFGSRCGLVHACESSLLDEEGHFACTVMPPEANAVALAVVAAALVGKVDCHALPGRPRPLRWSAAIEIAHLCIWGLGDRIASYLVGTSLTNVGRGQSASDHVSTNG